VKGSTWRWRWCSFRATCPPGQRSSVTWTPWNGKCGRPSSSKTPCSRSTIYASKKKVSSIHHWEIIIFILTFAVVIFAPSPSHPRSNRTGRRGVGKFHLVIFVVQSTQLLMFIPAQNVLITHP
jgi:hypothetical protein